MFSTLSPPPQQGQKPGLSSWRSHLSLVNSQSCTPQSSHTAGDASTGTVRSGGPHLCNSVVDDKLIVQEDGGKLVGSPGVNFFKQVLVEGCSLQGVGGIRQGTSRGWWIGEQLCEEVWSRFESPIHDPVVGINDGFSVCTQSPKFEYAIFHCGSDPIVKS